MTGSEVVVTDQSPYLEAYGAALLARDLGPAEVRRPRLRTEAEGGLAIRCDIIDRQMLLQAAPETFYITDHYTDSPMILINLETVRWDAMPGIIEQAWRMTATSGMIEAYDNA